MSLAIVRSLCSGVWLLGVKKGRIPEIARTRGLAVSCWRDQGAGCIAVRLIAPDRFKTWRRLSVQAGNGELDRLWDPPGQVLPGRFAFRYTNRDELYENVSADIHKLVLASRQKARYDAKPMSDGQARRRHLRFDAGEQC